MRMALTPASQRDSVVIEAASMTTAFPSVRTEIRLSGVRSERVLVALSQASFSANSVVPIVVRSLKRRSSLGPRFGATPFYTFAFNQPPKAARLSSCTFRRQPTFHEISSVAGRALKVNFIPSSRKALEEDGAQIGDLDLVETNEAFAPEAYAVNKDLGWGDPAIVNANGRAIAISHPIGASGSRMLNTLLSDARRALAILCMGVAMCLEASEGRLVP